MSRVFKRGSNWWIDFMDGEGVRRRRKVAPQKRIAQEALDAILGDVARREHLGIIEDSPISFSDFTKEWRNRIWHTLRAASQVRYQEAIDTLKAAFRGQLRTISPAGVEQFVADRVSVCAPSSVNVELAVIKRMMKCAVTWKYLARNPLADGQGTPLVKKLKEPPGRIRWFTEDEITRLLDACDHSRNSGLRAFVMLALNTGCRRNELLNLTRHDVNFSNNTAVLPDTKNNTSRVVYLNAAAISALRSVPVRIDHRFFTFAPTQVSQLFQRAVQRAGLDNARLHDCRHTFASHLAMSGVQQRGLQSLLGHKDGRMTSRYTHLSETYLRTAVDHVVLGASTSDSEVRISSK